MRMTTMTMMYNMSKMSKLIRTNCGHYRQDGHFSHNGHNRHFGHIIFSLGERWGCVFPMSWFSMPCPRTSGPPLLPAKTTGVQS